MCTPFLLSYAAGKGAAVSGCQGGKSTLVFFLGLVGHVCPAPSSMETRRQFLQKLNAFVPAWMGLAALLPLSQGTERNPDALEHLITPVSQSSQATL